LGEATNQAFNAGAAIAGDQLEKHTTAEERKAMADGLQDFSKKTGIAEMATQADAVKKDLNQKFEADRQMEMKEGIPSPISNYLMYTGKGWGNIAGDTMKAPDNLFQKSATALNQVGTTNPDGSKPKLDFGVQDTLNTVTGLPVNVAMQGAVMPIVKTGLHELMPNTYSARATADNMNQFGQDMRASTKQMTDTTQNYWDKGADESYKAAQNAPGFWGKVGNGMAYLGQKTMGTLGAVGMAAVTPISNVISDVAEAPKDVFETRDRVDPNLPRTRFRELFPARILAANRRLQNRAVLISPCVCCVYEEDAI